jgi:hypothetical protein
MISQAKSRRFPPPWTFEESNHACFIVRDANRFPVAYVYFENEPGRRAAARLMTKDEARRIAINIAKLPELIRAAQMSAHEKAKRAHSTLDRNQTSLVRLRPLGGAGRHHPVFNVFDNAAERPALLVFTSVRRVTAAPHHHSHPRT